MNRMRMKEMLAKILVVAVLISKSPSTGNLATKQGDAIIELIDGGEIWTQYTAK